MKHFFYALTALLLCLPGAQAQQQTHVLNGKTYFVYPYQQELEIPLRNFKMGLRKEEVIKRDSINRNIVSTEVQTIKYYTPYEKWVKKNKKVFLTIREQHPHILYSYNLPLEQDIVPTLDPLPDGDYVQFYRDLPYVSEDVLRYRNDVICAVFSLKNNQLDGPACWFSAEGDTIKYGNFTAGLKQGFWRHNSYKYDPDEEDIKLEGFLNGSYKDTMIVEVNYKDGLLDGFYRNLDNKRLIETGHFKNGKEWGEWHHYERKIIVQGIKTIYTDEPVLVRHYFIPEKPIKGKSVIVRNRVIELSNVDRLQFDVPYDNYFEAFSNYYELYKEPEEEGLELPDEKVRSYPGEEGEGYSEYGYDDANDIDFSYGRYDRKFYLNGKDYTRNDLIDSLGYQFRVEGIYEEFHRNGQLKMRFEVKDGTLVREDTIFWDNGNPVNVVTWNPETKEYSERTFDYRNKPITHLVYDEKGNFLRVEGGKLDANKHLINNRIYTANLYNDFFEYENGDTMNYTLTGPVVLKDFLWRFDSTEASITTFDPATRTYDERGYAINKQQVYQLNVQFGEDYENLSGFESYQIGKLESRTLVNGSYYKNPLYVDKDSVISRRAKYWQRSYETEYDNVLNYDGQPFNGKFSLTSHSRKFKLSSSEEKISLNFADGGPHRKALRKTYTKYAKKRKAGKLAPFVTQSAVFNSEVSSYVLYNIAPFTSAVFDPVSEEYFYEYTYKNGREQNKKISEKKAQAFDKTVEGQFRNGKPEGTWITRDQHGNLTASVPFTDGEIDGEVRYYATAYPRKEEFMPYDYYGYYDEENPLLRDSLPAKPVHYLSRVSHYKNGVLNGPAYEFNWMGDTITKMEYLDGLREGPSFERSKIAYTISGYEHGAVDGIMRTFLTIPGQDTTLLFDLNFQNGRLQGESKSYHFNGKIAKHGFFLDGEPIDDFEAFDTLGFRYQYVKFEYNQPVEEKIWEENQLSVRYTFDWRDSIYFNTSDIAGSQSLDRMLAQLGLNGDYYNQPYYGRPSVVDKSGINYHMTKYYPNDTIARDGTIQEGKKVGCWQFYNYDGRKLYEVEYADSIITVFDSIRFKSKGVLTYLDAKGEPLSRSYIVEKFEKYDCSHTDHYEVRMLVTFWEKDTSVHRMNGYVKNYYDNGVLQNEGWVKDGVATGVWKFYDPYGKLNQVGEYQLGKRQGRWLSGDLSQIKYMGDICLNPNLENLEEIMSYQEKLLDISVVYYQKGVVKKKEYYGVNMNPEGPPENYYGEEGYYEGDYYDDIRLR